MKIEANRKMSIGRGSANSRPPVAPPKMGRAARKLDAAFRAIAAGRVTVRQVEIAEPGRYPPRRVRATRQRLGVSVPVFARLLGVSAKLVEHWEQGRRVPAAVVCRLLDEVNDHPHQFMSGLMTRRRVAG